MTHPEDLRPGHFVALVDCKRGHWKKIRHGLAWIDAEDVQFDGAPLLVVSISLPFLCVETLQGRRMGLDVRDWDVQKVSKQYAYSMLDDDCYGVAQPALEDSRKQPGHCPLCGTRLRQRYRTRASGWRWVCPGCDYDGGRVPEGAVIVP